MSLFILEIIITILVLCNVTLSVMAQAHLKDFNKRLQKRVVFWHRIGKVVFWVGWITTNMMFVKFPTMQNLLRMFDALIISLVIYIIPFAIPTKITKKDTH